MIRKLLALLISFFMMIPQCLSVFAVDEIPANTDETDSTTETIAEKEIPETVNPLDDSDKDIRDISLDETVSVNIDENDNMIYYRFVPETDEYYVFESFATSGDPYCYLFDSSFEQIAYDDDTAGNLNFKLKAYLSAGTVYYFGVHLLSGYPGTFDARLSIFEPTALTSFGFYEDSYALRTGYQSYIYNLLSYTPYDAEITLDITSADPDVIRVDGSYLTGVSKGSTTVTVTANGQYTDSAVFTVGNYADDIRRENWNQIRIPVGDSVQLEYVLAPENEDVSDEQVTWSISWMDNGCIELSGDGMVTGIAGGYAEVKAEILNGRYVSYSISVYEQPTEISFVREVNGLSLGSSRDISNYVSFTPASSYACPYTVTSSDESIISVQDRQLYGVSKGTADITVTAENGVSATGTFKVGNYADYIISEQDYWVYLSAGESTELAYSLGRYDEGTCEDEEVTWSLRDNYNDCVSVDQNGKVTALRGGSATVVATISNGSGISYGIQVKESLTSLAFGKDEYRLRPGSMYNVWDYLEYEPYGAYGSVLDITSSDPDVIEIENGNIVTKAKGTAEITVTSKNGLSDSALFIVGGYAEWINSKGSSTIYIAAGTSKQLEYELYPTDEDTSDEVITWTVTYAENNCISVDENGVVTAHNYGYANVEARISNGDYTTFYIQAAEEPESLRFRQDTYYLDRWYGHSIWNYLEYTPYTAYGYPLTITVSDPNVIRLDGAYLYGNEKGTATITVSTGNLSTSAEFTVGDYAASIWAKESDVYMKAGEIKQLEYQLETGGYEAADEEIVWRVSSGGGVASVDQNGVVTANRNGTANVEARIKNGSMAYFTVHVYVDPVSLTFKENAYYLDKYYGHNIWNYLDCAPEDAKGSPLTITVSDESVVRVSGSLLYGLSNGTATVTVTAENGLSASAPFTVGDYAATISSDQYNYYLTPGETAQLEYTLRPEGNAYPDEKITWAISQPDKKIITLDQTGKVTALKTGSQEVTATIRNGEMTRFYVTVNPLPKKIAFSALDEYVAVNTARNINGMLRTIPDIFGGVSFTASSGNEKVAEIQNGTNVYGVSKGTTVLSVKTEEGLIAKTRLHVGNYAPSLSPKGSSEIYMAPGQTKKLEFTVGGSADYSDDEFTWELYYSDNECVRLSPDGTVTTISPGYATVTVTSLTGAEAWFYIYVQNQPTSLSFDEEEYIDEIGYTVRLELRADTELQGESNIVWTIADPSIASVSYSYGTFAEITGLKEGTTTIRAYLRDHPDVSAETKLTVYTPVEPTSISIPSSLTAYVDYYVNLPVNVAPEKASKDFVVETSNDNVIVNYVYRDSIVLLGNKAGTSVVTVKSADGKVSARTTVTVKNERPDVEGRYYIAHTSGNTSYAYYDEPEEYIFITGETYNFETSLYFGEYQPKVMSDAGTAIEECGLFENLRMRGAGGAYGQTFVSFFATASEAGTAELELIAGKKCRITVIDSAWLGTKLTAGNSIPSAVVNELRNSDLNLKYDISFAAAETLGQQRLSIPANKKAVLQSWLNVSVDSYVKDALGNIRYTLTLTPKFKVVTMNKTADSTSAGTDLIAESEPMLSVPANMVIPVKESIGSANVRRLTITHKTSGNEEYEYTDALLDEGLLFINQANGYGTFSIKAETSSYKEPVYTWTQKGEGYEVTALAQSEEGDPDITETVTAVYTVVEEPQCFKAGKGVYTAAFTNPLFDTQTMNVSIPAIGHHDYGTPQYTWSNDLSKATASAVCKVCGDEVKETVNTTYAVIKEPTKTETGTGRYTAVFTNALFETQTKDIVIPATGSGSDIIRIWFTEDEYTMTAGKKMVLIAHTDPEETTDTITFTSSDPSIVSNESNLLTAHKAGRVTITAKASNGVQAECSILVLFTDASDPNKFFYNPVYWAFEHDPQITTGTSETTFSPNENCTRGHIVTFLYRAAGEPKVSGKMPFTDVKEGKFYYNAVLWAVQNNITTGTSATTFSPNENCTRGHIVTFLYRYLKEPAVSGTVPFTDVKPGKFYYNAVLWAVKNNITTGTTSTTFSPNENCTRGQAVTFLCRAVQ